jgi:CubicO group peptidase (beta-lactamase class C family)
VEGKMKKVYFGICLFIIIISPIISNDNIDFSNQKDLTIFLDDIIMNYQVPGLALSIFNEEQILYTYTHGVLGTGEHINIDTPFFLGSTTKTITALCIMLLDYERKLSINDPVIAYLPAFYFLDDSISPDGANKITIEHLLNHTSGISNKGIPGNSMGENSLGKELLKVNNAKLIYPPGTTFEYCNLNYRLLGLIIEKVSGLSYGEFVKKHIFEVLEMENSYANPNEANGLVEGYGQLFGIPIRRNQNFFPGALPSGYLISSVSDVSKLLIDQLRASQNKHSQFPKELIETTWIIPEGINSNYAKGWMRIEDNGNMFLVHGGSLENYQSFFYLNPASKIGFVFTMNQGGFFPMMNSFNNIRDVTIEFVNNGFVSFEGKKKALPINIIIPLVVFLGQCALFFLIPFWKKNLSVRKKWSKISIGINLFWVVFFLFVFIPLMNAIMGDTLSLSMIWNMFPEFIIIILLIIISNAIRATMKIQYFLIKNNIRSNFA